MNVANLTDFSCRIEAAALPTGSVLAFGLNPKKYKVFLDEFDIN